LKVGDQGMKIRGRKASDGHYYIPAVVACGHPEFARSCLFLIDSGTTRTTLVSEKFGIKCSSLKRGNRTLSSMGPHTPYSISSVIIVFRTSRGKHHVELLQKVDVIKLKNSPFDGLLGMDVIGRFRFRGNKNSLTFES